MSGVRSWAGALRYVRHNSWCLLLVFANIISNLVILRSSRVLPSLVVVDDF
jgi:hypothetical protein